MKTNTKTAPVPVYNNEGTRVKKLTAEQELNRSVLATFLWEKNAYESGVSIAERIAELIPKVKAEKVAELAIKARNEYKLRHTPLFIAREMLRHQKHKEQVAYVLENIIQRADEISEMLSLYWKNGKTPISNQLKKGLAKAFTRFDEYDLAKYDRDSDIKLRDVLFLVHARPLNKEQEDLWKKLIDDKLDTPNTWETKISATKGEGKKDVWTQLLHDKALGGMAFLKNLRNLTEAGVDRQLIKAYFGNANFSKVLPFRFISAAKYAPYLEPELEKAMMKAIDSLDKLKGKTALIIDTSPSMWQSTISEKSEMNRFDAASALAILARGICEDVDIYAFNKQSYSIPPRSGFALRDALAKTQDGYSCGGLAVAEANKNGYDRIIVLTDGEWHSSANQSEYGWKQGNAADIGPSPLTDKAYMINVSNTKNGVGYGKWTSIDGFSESVVTYIQALEADKD